MEGIQQRLIGLQPRSEVAAARTFSRCFSGAQYSVHQMQQRQAIDSSTPGTVRTTIVFRISSSPAACLLFLIVIHFLSCYRVFRSVP